MLNLHERRRVLLVLLVTALMLTAGCLRFAGSETGTASPEVTDAGGAGADDGGSGADAGDGSSDGDGDSGTPTPTASPTPTLTPTPTPTPTPSPTPTPTPTEATSSGEISQSEWQQKLDTHGNALRNLDKFAAALVVRYEGDDSALQSGEQNGTVAYGQENGERLKRFKSDRGRRTLYQADSDSTVYIRTNASDRVRYDTRTSAITPGDVVRPFPAGLFAAFDWTQHGIVDTEQGPRERYTVTSLSAVDESVKEDTDGELVDIQVELLIHPEQKIITKFAFARQIERDGGTVTEAVAYVVQDIGTANVEEPSWLSEAKEQTS